MTASNVTIDSVVEAFRINNSCKDLDDISLKAPAEMFLDAATSASAHPECALVLLREYCKSSHSKVTAQDLVEATLTTLEAVKKTGFTYYDACLLLIAYQGESDIPETPQALADAVCKTLDYMKRKDINYFIMNGIIYSAKNILKKETEEGYHKRMKETSLLAGWKRIKEICALELEIMKPKKYSASEICRIATEERTTS